MKGKSGGSREPTLVAAFTINASSPNVANYITFLSTVNFKLMMPALTEKEIHDRIPYYHVAEETIMKAVAKVGGNPRTLFAGQAERADAKSGGRR